MIARLRNIGNHIFNKLTEKNVCLADLFRQKESLRKFPIPVFYALPENTLTR
jgi:hypothetical protein